MPPHLCYRSTSHREHRIKLKRREKESNQHTDRLNLHFEHTETKSFLIRKQLTWHPRNGNKFSYKRHKRSEVRLQIQTVLSDHVSTSICITKRRALHLRERIKLMIMRIMIQISLTYSVLLDKDTGGTITDTLTVLIRCYPFCSHVGYQTHTTGMPRSIHHTSGVPITAVKAPD